MSRTALKEVADGTFRLGTRWANFYLVRDGRDAILVDAGYPRYWNQVVRAADELGLSLDRVLAVLVTHHHVDHTGTAEQLRARTDATVLVHERDAAMVRGERRSHVPPGFYRQSWRPSMARYLIHTVAAGGARYRPVSTLRELDGDQVLELPGRPRVVPTPGHTAGHCSVVLEQRGVLLAGDAMVNFDYASGRRGPRLHRFNDDRSQALGSLARLESIDADIVLFGHGDPWTGGLRRAIEDVRGASSSPRAGAGRMG
jgi:glyoxylase-like metal-dependent hydrolase (beta-lactamase superfamily II)